ncbi:MAG TPA: response regulator [Pyrinomonadaceae bacterium]|jgi:DNA-binding response OmpR family regulator
MPPAIYKSKILLVEDHEDTSELMVLLLNQLDYEVATSASIADALALAESSSFDLFVLDSLLPDGTGKELCQRLRQRDHSTPILFYSAQAFERDKQEALSAGAQKYLVKPVDFGVFCDAVTELLSDNRHRRVSA